MSKHKLCLIGLALCAPLALSGCDWFKDYSLTPPDGWEKQDGQGMVDVFYLSPADSSADDFRENIGVTIEKLPENMTIKAYWDQAQTHMDRMFTNLNLLEEEFITLNGKDAVRTVYTHDMGQMKLKQSQYIVVSGKKALVLTCSALQDTYDEYEPTFKKCARTFKVN